MDLKQITPQDCNTFNCLKINKKRFLGTPSSSYCELCHNKRDYRNVIRKGALRDISEKHYCALGQCHPHEYPNKIECRDSEACNNNNLTHVMKVKWYKSNPLCSQDKSLYRRAQTHMPCKTEMKKFVIVYQTDDNKNKTTSKMNVHQIIAYLRNTNFLNI